MTDRQRAEREGFEPSRPLRAYGISSAAPSTELGDRSGNIVATTASLPVNSARYGRAMRNPDGDSACEGRYVRNPEAPPASSGGRLPNRDPAPSDLPARPR